MKPNMNKIIAALAAEKILSKADFTGVMTDFEKEHHAKYESGLHILAQGFEEDTFCFRLAITDFLTLKNAHPERLCCADFAETLPDDWAETVLARYKDEF